jgi:hypothetical protein
MIAAMVGLRIEIPPDMSEAETAPLSLRYGGFPGNAPATSHHATIRFGITAIGFLQTSSGGMETSQRFC